MWSGASEGCEARVKVPHALVVVVQALLGFLQALAGLSGDLGELRGPALELGELVGVRSKAGSRLRRHCSGGCR